MKRIVLMVLGVLMSLNASAWNAMGHKLVAQIAYNNLTPHAKKMCNQYNRSLNKVFPAGNFVQAAVWLDTEKAKDMPWFTAFHYIDIPYAIDDTPLPVVAETNALWAINQAVIALKSDKTSDADKGLSLRILIHIVGDIHQPLHSITRVSHDLPQGDLGGNLFPLASNPIGKNLHSYWDNGGGVLVGQSTKEQVRNKARQLQSKTSCASLVSQTRAPQWIDAAHELAISDVYTIEPGSFPSKQYQLNTQNISQKQILAAGCRLASLLNKVNR